MFDVSSVRSSTTSRPSREMSKSLTLKPLPKAVSGCCCPVSGSTSQRFLCRISPRRITQACRPGKGTRWRAPRASVRGANGFAVALKVAALTENVVPMSGPE